MCPENVINKQRVYVVVPAYNEAQVITGVIRGLLDTGYSIVAVDDGSTDGTWSELQSLPIHSLRHEENLGGGAALVSGINFAIANDAGFIATFDADGQHYVSDLERVLEPLIDGTCDVTIGSRFKKGGRALNIPAARWLILKLAAAIAPFFTGIEAADVLNGLRGMTVASAKVMKLVEPRESFAFEFLYQIGKNNLRYAEIPVTVTYSNYSLDKGVQNMSAPKLLIRLIRWRLNRLF